LSSGEDWWWCVVLAVIAIMIVLALSYLLGREKTWIPKEISMVQLSTSKLEAKMKSQSYLFLPPHSDVFLPPDVARTNEWIAKHRAHSAWNDGNVSHHLWRRLLAEFCFLETEIYAKGAEQVKFFAEALPGRTVIDLDSIGCPKAEEIAYAEDGGVVTCGVPNHREHCPLNKCMQYLFWLEDRQTAEEKLQREEEDVRYRQQQRLGSGGGIQQRQRSGARRGATDGNFKVRGSSSSSSGSGSEDGGKEKRQQQQQQPLAYRGKEKRQQQQQLAEREEEAAAAAASV
jgi:hypothetical protein